MFFQLTHRHIPDFKRPQLPPSNWAAAFLLILMIVIVSGCKTVVYKAVPECDITTPPNPTRFINANPDERQVLMTDAYIRQVRSTTECNNRIRVLNASNKAKDSLQ